MGGEHGDKYVKKTYTVSTDECFGDCKKNRNCLMIHVHESWIYIRMLLPNIIYLTLQRIWLFLFVKEKITNINLNQKNAFNYSRCRKMNDLRRKSPRDLLKIFKIKICSVPWEEISNSDLKEYFCNLMSENEENNEYEVFANNIDGRNYDNCTFESPDECITDKGIMKAIKKLGVN